MPIYLIRHPETTGASGRCIGQTDADLSGKGQRAIPLLAANAMKLNPDAVISSDLARCRAPALAIYAAGVPIWTQDPAWRELDFGSWDGREWDDIFTSENAVYENWVADFVDTPAPGGESFNDLHRRAWFALDRLREADLGCVVVVTHAGVIRALLAEDLKSAFDIEIPFGSIHPAPETG